MATLIYPPPEIRNKTANFVARNGVQFEERIKENEKHNAKFSFLNLNDPYRAYYDHRTKEFKEGLAKPKMVSINTAIAAPVPIQPSVTPIQEKIPMKPKPLYFLIDTPTDASWQIIETIKVTAAYAARHGKEFITRISLKESTNPKFQFLKPDNLLFAYFTKCVEHFSRILSTQATDWPRNKYIIFKQISDRLEYQNYITKIQEKKKNEIEQEKIAFASIDWHDFIVVETIEFKSNEKLPPPMSIKELEMIKNAKKKAQELFDMPVETKEEKETILPKTSKRIRTDYVPQVDKLPAQAEPCQICPRCGLSIKISEMEEHVRIELLDPKWKEQKTVFESRTKESNLVTTDVVKNLAKLSEKREKTMGKSIVPPVPPIPTSLPIPPLPPTGFIRPLRQVAPPPMPVLTVPSQETATTPDGLLPESVFLQKYSGAIHLTIDYQPPLYFENLLLTMTVNTLKEKIAEQSGLAVGKQKLITSGGLVMKNSMTLAYYNLVTGSVLSLSTKERGGKK